MKVPFPIDGLVEGAPSVEQPMRTSFSLSNVRPFDVTSEKVRGGKRPAMVKWSDTDMSNPIICMTEIVSTYIPPEV